MSIVPVMCEEDAAQVAFRQGQQAKCREWEGRLNRWSKETSNRLYALIYGALAAKFEREAELLKEP